MVSRKGVNDLLTKVHAVLPQLIRRAAVNGYNSGMPSKPKESRRTEQRNVASRNLDRMSAMRILRLMNQEDRRVAAAVGRALPAIASAVDAIVKAIRSGGRL